MTELRPYQQDVIARIGAEVEAGRRRVLLVAPTGSGKTVIAGAVVADAVGQQKQVLVLAHRRELIQQTSVKLHAVGVDHGIIQAGFPTRPGEDVQVASDIHPARSRRALEQDGTAGRRLGRRGRGAPQPGADLSAADGRLSIGGHPRHDGLLPAAGMGAG